MKTENLIKRLSEDLKPWKFHDSLSTFTIKWLCASGIIFGLCAWLMPWREDISAIIPNFFFEIENTLWIIMAVTSAFALHESTFPQSETRTYKIICGISLSLLIALAFKNHPASFAEQFAPELDLWRGRCGFIISGFAIIETPFLTWWAKRGAPKDAGLSGIYAALSSASLGCLLMQIICAHHNSLHMILWHFLPLTLMCFIGNVAAKKILRW